MKFNTIIYILLLVLIGYLDIREIIHPTICNGLLLILISIEIFTTALQEYRKKKHKALFIFLSLFTLLPLYSGVMQLYRYFYS